MQVEGTGLIAPTPVLIKLTAADSAYLQSAADERRTFRRYGSRGDRWGQGLIARPEFYGMLGEHGLCTYLSSRTQKRVSIDLTPRARGDGGIDVSIAGIAIENKTRVRGHKYLVRRIDGRGRLLPISADVVTFAKAIDDRSVELLGWLPRAEVRLLSVLEPSRVADHWNLSIPENRLKPMSQLVSRIRMLLMHATETQR